MRRRKMQRLVQSMMGASITTFGSDGHVPTIAWAVGRRRSIFAQPFTDEGLNVSEETRIMMHCWMARRVNATALGRVDEAWVKAHDEQPDKTVVWAGDLAEWADVDPTINTALCVEALDVRRDRTQLMVARLNIDDDGQPDWQGSWHSGVETEIATRLRLTAALVPFIDKDVVRSLTVLQASFFVAGWTLVESTNDR